jgi:hypothetical protein
LGKDVTAMGRNVTVMGQEKKETKKELKKHAATIHCSNTLSLLQRKISNALLYHAYQELMLKDEHEITVKQLCRLIGYQGNNHSVIKDALRELICTVIEWNLIDEKTGNENWTASSILASVSLEGPLCYYAYSPRMKQLLHSPSMFGKIDLVIQSKFRSSYGLALYENCIRYRGLPQTKWLDMALFKKLMGVPAGKYDVFRDFKRRVLDKAINEVNTYSDLIIEADYIKEGRKTVRVRFKLKDRIKRTRLGNHQQMAGAIGDPALRSLLLMQFGLSEDQADEVLSSYDVAYLRDKIAVVEASKKYREGKIENLSAYFLSAVKRNYQLPKAQQAKVISFQDAVIEHELSDIKRKVEEIRQAYHHHREQVINEAIEVLPKKKKQKLLQGFYDFAEPVIQTILQLQRNKYTRENVLESPQLKALLRRYALRELDLLAIITIEEFVMQQAPEKIAAWQKLKSHDPEHALLRLGE